MCDSVGLLVAGTMPDPCHTVIGADLEEPVPLPTMGPIPAYAIRVRITVQEPNPELERPCPTVLEPYERGFRLGRLPFGHYLVSAVEYVVPFAPDSSDTPRDSSHLSTRFDATPSEACPPGPGCALLGFGRVFLERWSLCDASGPPGGTACVPITLQNASPVMGVQTEIEIRDPGTGEPPPGSALHAVSVEPTERAAGFQVEWIAEGSRTRIILFSTGAQIAPGSGPILRVCYAIGPDTPEGTYHLRFGDTIVADPQGEAIPLCPTFAEIVGRLCIARPQCDLNGDGHSDILDVIRLVRCALAVGDSVHACPDSVAAKADCNSDGAVDIRDVICCVRKILASGGFGPGGGEPPDSTGATRIGFTGRVRWITPLDGRAEVEIRPGTGFGGIQFAVGASGSGARILGMRLARPVAGYQLESSVDPGGAWGRAMLFAVGEVPSQPIAVELMLEPEAERVPGGVRVLTLHEARSGTLAAEAMATRWTAATAEVPVLEPPEAPTVMPAHPNPFASETELAFALPAARRVTIRVYAPSGRLVKTLLDGTMPAGIHRARWDGRDAHGRAAGSGIYFVRFSAGAVERTARLVLLR